MKKISECYICGRESYNYPLCYDCHDRVDEKSAMNGESTGLIIGKEYIPAETSEKRLKNGTIKPPTPKYYILYVAFGNKDKTNFFEEEPKIAKCEITKEDYDNINEFKKIKCFIKKANIIEILKIENMTVLNAPDRFDKEE